MKNCAECSPSPPSTPFALLGSFGLFFTLFLLFCRTLPVIAMAEVKGVVAHAQAQRRHGS
jgi:hypothetical protein